MHLVVAYLPEHVAHESEGDAGGREEHPDGEGRIQEEDEDQGRGLAVVDLGRETAAWKCGEGIVRTLHTVSLSFSLLPPPPFSDTFPTMKDERNTHRLRAIIRHPAAVQRISAVSM